MFTSLEVAKNTLGNGAGFGIDELAAHLLIATGAGTPTGTATVPAFIGQIYIDTTNHKVYIAEATTDVNSFLILN